MPDALRVPEGDADAPPTNVFDIFDNAPAARSLFDAAESRSIGSMTPASNATKRLAGANPFDIFDPTTAQNQPESARPVSEDVPDQRVGSLSSGPDVAGPSRY